MLSTEQSMGVAARRRAPSAAASVNGEGSGGGRQDGRVDGRGVRGGGRQPVGEGCRGSGGRGMGMVAALTRQGRGEMVADDGRIAITCEFCSRRYDLDPAEVEAEIAGQPTQ